MQNDPEIHLTELDYRRRKPHPNFKDHVAVEKLVVKLGKSVSAVLLGYKAKVAHKLKC